jgi:hypothetical protein
LPGLPTLISARRGSVFGQQARFARADVVTQGAFSTWSRTGDEGTCATFHFCPQCGATVFWETRELPGWITIPVGVFADPDFPPPTVSVYEERMHRWVTPPPGAEHFD